MMIRQTLRTFNPEQVGSLVRTVVQIAGGAVVSHGLATGGQWEAVAAGVAALAASAWGLWAKTDSNLVASAAAVPAVDAIIATPNVAKSVASDKVTDMQGATPFLSRGGI